ncbi:MAG: hypothetical protein AAGF11_26735 [Myxococcota bacterium]
MEEAQKLWLIEQQSSGELTRQEASDLWDEWSVVPRSAATYFSTATDAALAAKLARDLGSATARVYYKSYNGNLHIVLKGRPGLRKILTGTKYSVKNAKVISMGLGPVAVRSTLRKGGVISIVLLTTYNIVDHVLRDEGTLMDLLGQIGSDVAKVGIATGASIAAAAALGTTGLVASFALGPLVVAVLVGVGTAMVLDAVDKRFQLTQQLKGYLNKAAEAAAQKVQNAKDQAEQTLIDLTLDLAEYVLREAGEAALRSIGQYIRKKWYDLTWADVY